jgi:hypothetical protein
MYFNKSYTRKTNTKLKFDSYMIDIQSKPYQSIEVIHKIIYNLK